MTALGPPKVRLISLGDQAALHTVREVSTNSVVSYYKRIAVNGVVVHGHTYSKTKQRNNSVVLLKDGSIFTVSHFIDMGDQCLYAIGKYGNCTVQKLARGSLIRTQLSYMSTVHFPTGFHKAINATLIVRPCMYIQRPQSISIVCRLLNTYYCKWTWNECQLNVNMELMILGFLAENEIFVQTSTSVLLYCTDLM